MRRAELDTVLEWAAAEGWNPGLHDAQLFWDTDPEAFIAAEVDGQLAGGGAIVSYGGAYGFMGLFIVRKDLRSHGIGSRLWHERKRMLLARLHPGAPIGMDGVFAMEAFYSKGGFVREHRELRFEAAPGRSACGTEELTAGSALGSPLIVPIDAVPANELIRYDSMHFPAARPDFVRRWIAQPRSCAVAAVSGGALRGFSVARPARMGMRIGPLFADSPPIAESLLAHMLDACAGVPVHLDVPERNPHAMALAARHGMREIFGCAKMTLGAPPALPWSRIYGVTSFELG